MAKAIIWVRSSTTAQECESQREELIKTATSEPYKFKKSDLIEIGKVGASAIKLNKVYQQEVNQLLDAIDNETDLSTIFVWEVSRLARNEQAFYAMKNKIIDKKIQLICKVPQIKLLDDNGEVNQGMEITLNLLVTLAKQEMDIKKKRFARGKKQKAKEGKYSGGRIPFGYRVYPEKDNWIDIDEKEAEIVKMIYDMYEEGISQTHIAIELAERGYNNPRYKVPKIIHLGQIANILTNECYTGVQLEEKVVKVKNKTDDEETEWIRYARKYPQIITIEQYQKCREIAKANKTNTGKGKNIYYATKLVKCPICGCYWSASGSKAYYHCYNAVKRPKIWTVDGRTTEQCQNRTSLSINVLDSILWYFAKREEAKFILQASGERREALINRIRENQEKIDNIPAAIDKINAEINKLALRNAEGYLSDEIFENRIAIKNKEKSQLIDKKLTYKKRIEELNKAIEKIDSSLKNYGAGVHVKHVNGAAAYLDALIEYIRQFNEIYKTLCNITDDKERYEIIHRVFELVCVENVKIKYKYKIGWRETRAKKIILLTPNWYEVESVNMPPSEIPVYYLPFNGKDKGLVLSIGSEKYDADDDNLIVDDDGNIIGHAIRHEWLKDYKETSEAQFEDEDTPHPVTIIDIPYLNRFTDYGKNKRVEKDKEEAYRPVKDYLRVEDVMAMGNLKSSQVYGAIYKGTLKALIIRHKYFISPIDAEQYIAKVNERDNKENKLSAFEIAKRFNVHYLQVLRRVKSGILPSEYVNGGYLIRLEDAEKYFSTEHKDEGKRNMNGKISAASIAKMYGVSYKSVRKKLRTGEIPSSKIGGYFYVDPKDAEEYFGITKDELEGMASAPLD